jgi:hypothetical protein
MSTKPTSIPTWATDPAAGVIAPTGPQQATGWTTAKPPYQWFNWWMKAVGSWLTYLDGLTGAQLPRSGTDATTIDAAIGAIPIVRAFDTQALLVAAAVPSDGSSSIVKGQGGAWVYLAAATDLADGETILAPAVGGGRYYQELASLDDLWVLTPPDWRDSFLQATALIPAITVAAGATYTQAITVNGARQYDPVDFGLGPTFPASLNPSAVVTINDVVTFRVFNPTAAGIAFAADKITVQVTSQI